MSSQRRRRVKLHRRWAEREQGRGRTAAVQPEPDEPLSLADALPRPAVHADLLAHPDFLIDEHSHNPLPLEPLDPLEPHAVPHPHPPPPERARRAVRSPRADPVPARVHRAHDALDGGHEGGLGEGPRGAPALARGEGEEDKVVREEDEDEGELGDGVKEIVREGEGGRGAVQGLGVDGGVAVECRG